MKLLNLFLAAAVLLMAAGAGIAAAEGPAVFTDDYGRAVALPAAVDKVLPSGPLALSVLMSFDADYLASCGAGMPPHSDRYLPELYALHLPLTGALLPTSNTVNYEEVMRLNELGVDVYVDVGQSKTGAREAIDDLTAKTGLPSVFISQDSLDLIPASYRKVGEVLGDTRRGNELYQYLQGWVDTINSGMQTVDSSGTRVSAVHIVSIDGNNFNVLGGYTDDGEFGYQGTVVNTLADNVFTALSNKGAGDTYSMEEFLRVLIQENPDVIFINGAPNHAYYFAFINNPAFAELSAVKSGKVYEIPADCPYTWTPRPFSGWGVSGLIWAANLLYPDVFSYDAKDKIQEFYKIMINYELSDAEYTDLTTPVASAATPAPFLGILAGCAAAGLFLLRRTF